MKNRLNSAFVIAITVAVFMLVMGMLLGNEFVPK